MPGNKRTDFATPPSFFGAVGQSHGSSHKDPKPAKGTEKTYSPPGSVIPQEPKNVPDQWTTDALVAAQPQAYYNAQKVATAAASTNAINAAAVQAATDAKNKKIAVAAGVGAGALLLLLL
jgi:hypothetical protein